MDPRHANAKDRTRYCHRELRYCHEPLPGPEYIRVFTLYPSQELRSPVIGEMRFMPLERRSQYAALSYSWGTNKDGDVSTNHWITISGRPFPVTQNLSEALQRLRSTRRPQPVWIDAICINQVDVTERNEQVAKMARIYEYASQVVAWLGEGRSEKADREALALLKCLEQAPHAHHDFDHHDYCEFVKAFWNFRSVSGGGRRDSARGSVVMPYYRFAGLPSTATSTQQMENIVKVIGEFLCRRYFSRRWIVQELYHPAQERILFAWGPCKYPVERLLPSLDHLQQFLETARRAWLNLDRFHPASRRYSELSKLEGLTCDIYNMLQMKIPDETGLTLQHALHRCAKFQCADARDIPFALVSLDPSFGLIPDYSMSVADTFTAFAKIMVQKGLVSTVLHNLRDQHTTDKDTLKLPTWVPDLRRGFIDDVCGELLPAKVGSSNVIGAELYVLGSITAEIKRHRYMITYHERDRWGDENLQVRPGNVYTVFELDRYFNGHGKRFSFKRRSRSLLEVWVHGDGTEPAETAAAIQPGDLVCAVRQDWWQRNQDDDLVLLRASKEKVGVHCVVRVFAARELNLVRDAEAREKRLAMFSTPTMLYLG